jgi:hypothetical protein
MADEQSDLVELFDYAYGRLIDRMAGLGDDEWNWSATPDKRVGLRWRLHHLAEMLAEPRNAVWLGRPSDGVPSIPQSADLGQATEALRIVQQAFSWWRGQLELVSDLAAPIGAVAGPYGDATRRSFVLHIADEFIHHSAEAALLRDLWAARG